MINTNRIISPGTILLDQYLKPLALTPKQLASDIHIHEKYLISIIEGERAIDKDMAHLLGKYFKTSPEYWLNMQKHYELRMLKAKST